MSTKAQVAVVVPGIMGSVLMLDGKEVWPGSFLDQAYGYGQIKELLDDRTRPTDVIRCFKGMKDVYAPLLSDLERCGFHEKADPPTLVTFPYDWRRSITDASSQLADALEKVIERHKGEAELSIVAHSMGGLVARHYLECDRHRGKAGHAATRRLITLGTPHRGSPQALVQVLGFEDALAISKEDVKKLTNDKRFPAAYQLLPPPGEKFLWDGSAGSQYMPVDPYDSQTVKRLGLSADNIRAAADFHKALANGQRPGHVRYFCFAGTAHRTTSMVQVVWHDATTYRLIWTGTEGAGDSTVPHWSASLPDAQHQPVGGAHQKIFRDRSLRTTLSIVLGSRVRLDAAEELVQVSLRDSVINIGPNSKVHAVLSPIAVALGIEGELRVEPITSENPLKYGAAVAIYPVSLKLGPGVEIEGVEVRFPTPPDPGAYRVAFYRRGGTKPDGDDEMLVVDRPEPAVAP